MVGVPGKSKGCFTCRKRKIKCDEASPCAQCISSNRVCKGYEKTFVFVNKSMKDLVRRKSRATRSPSSSYEFINETITSSRQAVIAPSDTRNTTLEFKVQRPWEILAWKQGGDHGTCLGQRVDLVPVEHIQNVTVLIDYFVPNISGPGKTPLSWTQVIPDLPELSETLRLATAALAHARVGRVNRVPSTANEGLAIYSKALLELRRTLRKTETALKAETLVSMQILALYELLESTTQAGWFSHMWGITSILKARGPHQHIMGASHQFFLGFRANGFQATLQRKASFLADIDWRTIPWTHYPKNPFHHFLDLAVELPGLLERADALSSNNNRHVYLRRLHLFSEFLALSNRFEAWEREFVTIDSETFYWLRIGCQKEIANGKCALEFRSVKAARTLTHYWGTLVTMYITALRESAILKLGRAPKALPGEDKLIALGMATAKKIIGSVDYCTQEEWRSFGVVLLVFPLKEALKWYKSRRTTEDEFVEEIGWCRTALLMINNEGDGHKTRNVQESEPRKHVGTKTKYQISCHI